MIGVSVIASEATEIALRYNALFTTGSQFVVDRNVYGMNYQSNEYIPPFEMLDDNSKSVWGWLSEDSEPLHKIVDAEGRTVEGRLPILEACSLYIRLGKLERKGEGIPKK